MQQTTLFSISDDVVAHLRSSSITATISSLQKNYYRDSQATTYHLNVLVAEQQARISFYVLPMTNSNETIELERAVMRVHAPGWNIALKPVLMSIRTAS
jgi:hypothetical protein